MIASTYKAGKFYLQQSVYYGDVKGEVVSIRITSGAIEPTRIYELNWMQNGDLKSGWFYEWQLEASV